MKTLFCRNGRVRLAHRRRTRRRPGSGDRRMPLPDGRGRPDHAHRARRRERDRGRSRVRRPARPPADARARGRGDDRVGHAGGRRRRLLRHPRDAEHRAGRGQRVRPRRARRARAGGGGDSHGVHGGDQQGPGGRGAHGDGRARGCRRRRVHRRRAAGGVRRAAAARAPVQRPDGAPAGAPLRGSRPLPRWARARGRRCSGARSGRISLGRGERHGGTRPRAGGVRGAAAACHAHVCARVGRRAPRRAGSGRAGDGRGDAAPPVPDRRGAALARPQREDEPAAALGGRSPRARGGAPGRHDRGGRDRPRAPRAPGEGGPVRGGAVRRDGPRDGVLGALHLPRRAGRPRAGDAPRAHVCRAGSRARVARASNRGRRASESRPARPRRRVAGRRGVVPLPVEELVAPRTDANGARRAHRRRRPGGVRACSCEQSAISCSRTERSSAGSPSRPTASRSGRRCSRPR